MKKTFTILMALMALCFTQCKPTPEGGDDAKVRVSCVIPINDGDKSDFTNLMETGKVNWSEGRECVYVAIHGEQHTIIELEGFAYGNPSKLTFEGEVAEDLLTSGAEYDIWYFGHSHQKTPNYSLDGNALTGSIANQSGSMEDLGYCHIAKTTVTAETVNGEVKLNLNGTLKNQIAIALLDLENVTKLYGDAIIGTEYALEYTGGRYELNVVENNTANISVGSRSGNSYIILLPNEKKETKLKCVKGGKTYATTFFGDIKANKIYYRTASDGATVESLPWSESEIQDNGYEYVDLGLPSGLLWATCNVGATAPEEYGNYYAWGETTTKGTYLFGNSTTYKLSKSELQSQGYIDGEGNLTSQYDAATANWGGDWRTPTKTEFEELINNCTWTWTEHNGVVCYKVEGPNGNSIFLPSAGYYDGSQLKKGSGNYWSSTINDYYGDCTYSLYFDYSDYYTLYGHRRSDGKNVRPVSGPETPNSNDHSYVDLGLSVKWATCNVGAETPEGYGDYFAWGETSTKATYTEGNCPTYGLSISQLQSQGYIDSEGNLTAQYDAATANWGGDWRMPTYDELYELSTQCTWTWTTQNGVNGYKVKGPNGNSIFLPAAGFRYGSSLYSGSGDYLSSTPYESDSEHAYDLYFSSSNHGMEYYDRIVGWSVRPVIE